MSVNSQPANYTEDKAMDIIIQSTPYAACSETAHLIARQLARKPNSVIGFACGDHFDQLFAELIRLREEDRLDFSAARFLNFTIHHKPSVGAWKKLLARAK